MVSAGKKYRVNPDILCEKEVDGMLLFDPHSGEVKILNETGAFVFELLRGGNDFCSVLVKLGEEFEDFDPVIAEADLLEVVSQLTISGIIYEIQENRK